MHSVSNLTRPKGPGYGLILASCPGFSAAPNTLLYMIKDPSNGMSLGPNGWQPGDAHLVPDAVAPSGEILSLSVGPAVVDSLELQAIYQVVLFTDAEHVWQGGLSINRIVYSRDPSLLPDLELAPKAAPSAGREPMPHAGNGNRPRTNVALLRWETRLGGPGQRTAESEGTPKKLQKPYPEHHLCYPYGNSACRGRILHLYAGPAQNGHDAGGKARRSPEA